MRRKYKRLLFAFVLALIILPGVFVKAETPSDAVITMEDVQGYRNLGTPGDMLIIGRYRWASDNVSSTPASSAVTIRLVAANGTLLDATAPYVYAPFADSGYGDVTFSFYFTDNTTWGQASVIEIAGYPAYFTTPPTLPYTIQSGDYTNYTTQGDNRDDMATYILNLTDILLGIYPLVELKSITDSGQVLSTYGEAYFTSVIEGLQTLCPDLFIVQVSVPEEIEVQDYDMSTAAAYTGRLPGTDLWKGFTRIGAYINVTGYVIFGLIIFAACIAVIIATARRGWDLEAPLLIDVGIVAGGAVLAGDLLFTIIMIIGLLSVMGVSYAVLGKRA